MTKRFQSIKEKLTRVDAIKLKVFGHPRRQQRKYYQHRIGLTRKPNLNETIWLNKHTKANYSIDHTIAPHNISFQDPKDAVLFKLVWWDDLACQEHPPF